LKIVTPSFDRPRSKSEGYAVYTDLNGDLQLVEGKPKFLLPKLSNVAQHIVEKLKPQFKKDTDLIVMTNDHWIELIAHGHGEWLEDIGNRAILFGPELKNSAIIRTGYGSGNRAHMGFY
jgi:hypothetical protein